MVNRISRLILCVTCFAMFAFLLVGCSYQTDEEAIEQSISNRLDGYKNIDSSETANFASRMDIDSLAQYGVSEHDFMAAYFDDFDYLVQNVAVDGDNAVATVVLTCKSFTEYEKALQEATDAMKADASIAKMSTDELDKAFGKTILDTLKDVEVRQTEPIEISFEKVDNVWEPVSNASEDIAAALMSN
ncbi:hypothetical protein [Adlercreutzia sp. ZJ304]|uniref:hypothetical protein n=1 Tax=Adlercreutzia sp. ZJ304 TaxID=2709791 RepID=UPI0013EA968E|nr:hypothetical protein [Adlercreutzia sp. ZJ304]